MGQPAGDRPAGQGAAAFRSCVCDYGRIEGGGCCRRGRRMRGELLGVLRPCFARTQPWLQAGKYAAAVMSDLRRRVSARIALIADSRSRPQRRELGDGNVVDVHTAGLSSFQCPSEMTSTPQSVTLMAV